MSSAGKTGRAVFLALAVGIFLPPFAAGQTGSSDPVRNPVDGRPEDGGNVLTAEQEEQTGKPKRVRPPKAVTHYMGRRIAQTMHYEGAPWLIRNEREREERCSMMLVNLGLRPGMTVCDMGCGNGFHSLPIAQMVGDAGQILAVDIQPEMLVLLRERMEESGVTNITPILGSAWDPHLPAGTVDLVLMVDVYHEFSHPEPMLAAIRRSLSAGGVVVLVEFRAEDPEVPIQPLHRMSREQVDLEMEANGFRRVREFDRLPWQHLLVYAADEPVPEGNATGQSIPPDGKENRPKGKGPSP